MNEPKKDCQKGEWWTAPAIGDKGGTVIVTGRKDVDKFRTNPRMNIRVEVTWSYDGDDAGMPSGDTPALMAQVHERSKHPYLWQKAQRVPFRPAYAAVDSVLRE